MIQKSVMMGALGMGMLAGCASYPVPVQRMADAEAASRSAQDLGASTSPQGQLHLRLAQEEIAQAKQLIANSSNERADYVLIRAKADAELALAEAKDTTAERQALQAQNNIKSLQSSTQPATATVTTTATSASTPPPPAAATTTTTSTSTKASGGQK